MERKFTEENFEKEVLESDVPVLVDFYADWCGPCKMIAPLIEELAKEFDGKVKIGKLNVDESSSIASRYGVMTIPTLLYIKNGEEVKRSSGVQSKAVLISELNSLL